MRFISQTQVYKITFTCFFLLLCINSSNCSGVEGFWEEIVSARVQRRWWGNERTEPRPVALTCAVQPFIGYWNSENYRSSGLWMIFFGTDVVARPIANWLYCPSALTVVAFSCPSDRMIELFLFRLIIFYHNSYHLLQIIYLSFTFYYMFVIYSAFFETNQQISL